MPSRPFVLLRRCARFCLGPVLLAGLGLAWAGLATPAHAQTTLTVTSCASDSQLQADVSMANSDNANDTITFSCSGDITVTSTLNISGSMTLDGSGQSVTLDGAHSVQVISVTHGGSLALNALTVANGSTSGGGGGLNNNGGTVSITNSAFTGNSSPQNMTGGAIFSNGSLTITGSTFTGNTGYFGTVYNTSPGQVSITGSTFTGNTTTYGGSGVYNDIGGTASITNSTIANNAGTYGTGLFDNGGTATVTNSTIANNTGYGGLAGGILTIQGTVNISGSIVANNSGGDCANYGTINDNGYNLDSDNSCFTAASSLHANPQLAGLASNGGPTQTEALQQGSPAIDAGPPAAQCPTTDQRGDLRPDNGESACDIGAYEYQDTIDNDLALTNVPANVTANATGPQGAVVTYTPPTVVDEDTPLPSVSCGPASGSTFAIGTTQVQCTVTASNDANSPVSASFIVTVNGAAAQVSNLNTTVASFGLPPDFQASLDTQLQTVQTDLTSNNTIQACHDLAAFLNHAKAQSGKGLTASQANQLVAAAKQVQAVLGC